MSELSKVIVGTPVAMTVIYLAGLSSIGGLQRR